MGGGGLLDGSGYQHVSDALRVEGAVKARDDVLRPTPGLGVEIRRFSYVAVTAEEYGRRRRGVAGDPILTAKGLNLRKEAILKVQLLRERGKRSEFEGTSAESFMLLVTKGVSSASRDLFCWRLPNYQTISYNSSA